MTPANPPAPVPGLRCPACGGNAFRVLYTRKLPGGAVRRYRRCLHCRRNVVTIERIFKK